MATWKLILKYLLGLLFIVAGIVHFLIPEFFMAVMPPWMSLHLFLVLLTGATEIIAGVLLLIPRTSRLGAWLIVGHLLAFFTIHIDMVIRADAFPDIPLWILWLRLVFQFVFLAWAWPFVGWPLFEKANATKAV
ncbi:MAG: DoxX family protein [Gemmataceae bacterium]